MGLAHTALVTSRGPGWALPAALALSEWPHYLVIDEYLHRVVAPLDEDQLIGLPRDGVREGRAHSGRGTGLEPHAHSEGVHLRQALLHLGVHVVGPQRERQLKLVSGAVVFLTWGGQDEPCHLVP